MVDPLQDLQLQKKEQQQSNSKKHQAAKSKRARKRRVNPRGIAQNLLLPPLLIRPILLLILLLLHLKRIPKKKRGGEGGERTNLARKRNLPKSTAVAAANPQKNPRKRNKETIPIPNLPLLLKKDSTVLLLLLLLPLHHQQRHPQQQETKMKMAALDLALSARLKSKIDCEIMETTCSREKPLRWPSLSSRTSVFLAVEKLD